MFKVKIRGRDSESYYVVYEVNRRLDVFKSTDEVAVYHTEFLTHDRKNGFHWVNARFCTPV